MEIISSLWFNTQFTLEKIPFMLKLKGMKTALLGPTIQVEFVNEHYVVKTATTAEEFAQVLSLRFEIFFREFSTKRVTFSLFPYDVDSHDFICDHLIVKDRRTNQVVACYRLLAESAKKKRDPFYSESEFVLDDFLGTSGEKLELGRACVHKDYRKGVVIALLWRGLLEYAKKCGARYMFGCSSINRKDFSHLPQMMNWLKENNSLIDNFKINVQDKFLPKERLENLEETSLDVPARTGNKVLGSLMHMYVMAGAKIGESMAYDSQMDCVDLFTLIDLKGLPLSFERRFS